MGKVRNFGIGVVLLLILFSNTTLGQATKEQLQKIRSTVIEKVNGRSYYIHTIKRGQTLYMISKAYGVEVNELIGENPQVKNGIKADEKIRIPISGQKIVEQVKNQIPTNEAKVQPAENQSAAILVKTKQTDSADILTNPCGTDSTMKRRVFQVALMLPLYLGELDQINTDPKSTEPEATIKSFQFIQFYEGYRIAVDSLVKTGLRIKLWIYDVDKDTGKTRQVLKKPELRKMDLIIGLLYTLNFQIVADFAEKYKINIVNPISERSNVIAGHPNVFKMQPAKKSRMDIMAAYMSTAFTGGQVMMVHNGQYQDHELQDQLKKACQDGQLQVQEVEGQEAAISKLQKDRENYLVVFSESPAYILDLTRGLFELHNDYPISIVGLPDWSQLEGLETDYLVSLKAHMEVPWFIDYHAAKVKKFIHTFSDTYKTDPDPLAFKGYDAGFYFLSALMKYGPDFQRCIGEYKMKGLQATFDFARTSKTGGFENRRWEIFKYENYKLIQVY